MSEPTDEQFASFGKAAWAYTKETVENCGWDETIEEMMPLAEAAGLCRQVIFDPDIHGDIADAEPGSEIWWWGNELTKEDQP